VRRNKRSIDIHLPGQKKSTAKIWGLFFIHLYAATFTLQRKEPLTIKYSIFYHQSITIDTIKTITKVTDIFSAPAFSVKRLLICFYDTGSAVISPKDESVFIRLLTELNPKISVH